MKFDASTPRVTRSIGAKDGPSFDVQVPTPFAEGQALTLTAGLANILNQTIAENLSNNLRAKLVAGATEGEGDAATTRQFTPEEAQALVDAYLTDYEPGVRRAGDAAPRLPVDPVEREVRNLAVTIAKAIVTDAGKKWKDVDQEAIIEKIITVKGDELRAKAKTIVKQRSSVSGTDGLDISAMLVAPAPATEEAPAA